VCYNLTIIHFRNISHQVGVVCRQVKKHCVDPLTRLFMRVIALLGACFQSTPRLAPIPAVTILTTKHIRERLRVIRADPNPLGTLRMLFPDQNGVWYLDRAYPHRGIIFTALKGLENYNRFWRIVRRMDCITQEEAVHYCPTLILINELVFLMYLIKTWDRFLHFLSILRQL